MQTVMGQTAHSTADGAAGSSVPWPAPAGTGADDGGDSDQEDAELRGPSPRSFPDHPDHLLYESVRVLYEAVQGEREELGYARGASIDASRPATGRPPSPRSSATVRPESPPSSPPPGPARRSPWHPSPGSNPRPTAHPAPHTRRLCSGGRHLHPTAHTLPHTGRLCLGARHLHNPPREGAPRQSQKTTTTGPSPHPSAAAARPRSAGCRFIPSKTERSRRRARRVCSSTILPTRRPRRMRTARTTRTTRSRTWRTLGRYPLNLVFLFWELFLQTLCILGVGWQKMASVPRGTKWFQ